MIQRLARSGFAIPKRVTPVWYISKKKGCTCLRTLPSARLRQRSSSLGRTAGNGVHLSKRGDWQQLAKLQIFRKPAFMIRSEEHTSELQSLMRISYAVFCLKKKNK